MQSLALLPKRRSCLKLNSEHYICAQCGLENRFWDKSKSSEATRMLQEIDESTLGQLLRKVRTKSEVAADIEATLREGLRIRNKLCHGFYLRHGNRIQTGLGPRL